MVCIIDDREDVWNFAPNLVHVKPYSFFKQTGDINAPPGSKDAIPAKKGEKTASTTTPSNSKNNIPTTSNDAKSESEIEPPAAVTEPSESDEKTKSEDTVEKEKKTNSEDPAEENIEDDLELSDDDMEADEQNDAAKDKAKEEEEGKKEEAEGKEGKKDQGKCEDDLLDVEDTDDYLLYLEDILKTIHKAYYDLLDQMKDEGKEVPNLKTVIPYVKRKVLQGISVVFSGVVPTHVPLRKSRAYMVARSLGATVTENVVTADSGGEEPKTVRTEIKGTNF